MATIVNGGNVIKNLQNNANLAQNNLVQNANFGIGGMIGIPSFVPNVDQQREIMNNSMTLLFKDHKEQLFPDVVYPFEFDIFNSCLAYHLVIFKMINKDTFDKMIYIPKKKKSYVLTYETSFHEQISFLSRRYRNEFKKWWNDYTKIFFNGVEPKNIYLPSIKPGYINGTFIEHKSVLDNLSSFDTDAYTSVSSNFLSFGLTETLYAWAWIVYNCKKPVYKVTGGWIFKSTTEASNFILFNPKNTEMI